MSPQSKTLNDIVEKAFVNGDTGFFLSAYAKERAGNQGLANAYLEHPWVFAAVDAIARNISAVPFKIWKDDDFKNTEFRAKFIKRAYQVDKQVNLRQECLKFSNKASGFEEVKNHPFAELFDEPNPHITATQLWEATIVYLLTEGACFWILQNTKTRSSKKRAKGIPDEIWPTGPDGWAAVLDEAGQVVVGWKYTVTSHDGKTTKVLEFDASEVIWFHGFNPKSQLIGHAKLASATLSIEQDHEAALYNQSFFKNGAIAGTILETDEDLTDEQRRTMSKSWKAEHQGAKKGNKLAILTNGLKAKTMTTTHRDMEYQKLRQWTRDEILAVLGVPKSMVGVIEDVNRASFLGSKRAFFECTLIPIMEYISLVLYVKLFKPVDETLFGFFDLALMEGLRGDLKEKSEVAKTYFNMGYPLNVVNDRLDLGFPNVPHGDTVFVNGTMFDPNAEPEDQVEEDNPPAPKPVAPNGGDEDDQLPAPKMNLKGLEQVHIERFKETVTFYKTFVDLCVDFVLTKLDLSIFLITVDFKNRLADNCLVFCSTLNKDGSSQALARLDTSRIVNTIIHDLKSQCGYSHKEWHSKTCLVVGHRALHGTIVEINEKLNGLLYPGDSDAPLGKVLGCSCHLEY